jgi:hypothetical protein
MGHQAIQNGLVSMHQHYSRPHLGPAERYLDHDVASSICDFIYGDVNAETIYDTYTNIDILIVLTLATVIYRLTTLLLKKIRK